VGELTIDKSLIWGIFDGEKQGPQGFSRDGGIFY
jgi:hypothetical protein